MLDRELKKGSAELIILSIVEPRARHGYEISKLIEQRSAGQMRVPRRLAVPAALPARGTRLAAGPLGGEGRRAAAPLLQPDRRGPPRAHAPARDVEDLRRRDGAHHRSGPCLTGSRDIRAPPRPAPPRPAREAEIVEELSQHLDQRYEELRASGVSDAEARVWSPRSCWSPRRSPPTCGRCGRRTCPRPIVPRRTAAILARGLGAGSALSPRGHAGSSRASPRRPS